MNKITFNLNNKEYELPDYLTISDYVKIFKIKDLFEDDYLYPKIINLITGCPLKELMEAEHSKVEYLATHIFSIVPRPPYKFIDRFELDGVEYGFIPSYKGITFGEFIDLDTLLTKKPNEIMDNLHIIAAIMYRPIISKQSKNDFKIEKYNVETMEKRAELFKNKLRVDYVLGGQFFFINFGKIYSNYIPQSLTMKLKREWVALKWMIKNWRILWRLTLKKDLDGTSFLTEYVKMTLKNTTKSLRKN